MKPEAETLQILRDISCEINCGKVLFPKSPAEWAHNNACDRAQSIISSYAEGIGLFQMSRDAARTDEPNDQKA